MNTFEWDPAKAVSNLRKHGVSFEIAVQVFADPWALSDQDQIVNGEVRWTTIGVVNGCLLLTIADTDRESQNADGATAIIRIISARKADRNERRSYEEEIR